MKMVAQAVLLVALQLPQVVVALLEHLEAQVVLVQQVHQLLAVLVVVVEQLEEVLVE
jgi:hypothetical protein